MENCGECLNSLDYCSDCPNAERCSTLNCPNKIRDVRYTYDPMIAYDIVNVLKKRYPDEEFDYYAVADSVDNLILKLREDGKKV